MLVADFLHKNNLKKSYKTLVEEAGLFDFKNGDAVGTGMVGDKLTAAVQTGDWPSALAVM